MENCLVNIETADGRIPSHVIYPGNSEFYPVVIFFMDGLGVRQELISMAERIAQNGYFVLLPDMYYRLNKESMFDVEKVFTDPAQYQLMIQATASLTDKMVMSDIAGILSYLDQHPAANPVRLGAVGYCLGGGMVVRAMINFPERFSVGASFHGGNLINDTPNSPHRLVGKIKGFLYLGFAEIDEWMSSEAVKALTSALDAVGASYKAEVYAGTRHGWAVRDIPVYQPRGADLHWDRLLNLLDSNLKVSTRP